jgi:hypothetical protein
MQFPRCSISTALIAANLLTACGGGGGGSAPAAVPPPVTSLASLAATDIPAQWPDNFRPVTVQKADLASDAELALTTNAPSKVLIQIWYLDQDKQRQPVAVLTLSSLISLGGRLTIPQVPGGVKTLFSEVYTAKDNTQQTLAKKEIAV